MKKLLLSFIVLISFYSFSFSQKIIEVSYEKESSGDYLFSCINNDVCDYTVTIGFSELKNLASDFRFPYNFIVTPGRSEIFVLKKINVDDAVSFTYAFKFIKGILDSKLNSDFVYLLPVGKGKITQTLEIKYHPLNENDSVPKNKYVMGFSMKYLDTVYAARGGIVTGMSDPKTNFDVVIGNTHFYKENFIETYHNDGTFGNYQIFSKIFVVLGQKIVAGDPIGLVGGQYNPKGPHVRYSVTYNYVQTSGEMKNKDLFLVYSKAYVPLVFYTKENKNKMLTFGNEYTAEYPESVITQEMSKRQIKLREKSKTTE